MKQWIRWWGLGLIAAIVLVVYWGINPLITWSVESLGSKAVGAKVELASSELKLSPLSLTLNDLAITNPEQPMQNIVRSDSLNLSLDTARLLRRQVIVEQAVINGLRFNTERSHSGALTKKSSAVNDDQASGFSIPGISLPDPKVIAANEKAKLMTEIDASKNRIKAIETLWQQRLKALPDKQALADYKTRWKALKEKNWLEKINDTKALQKDIKKDNDAIRSLDDQLKQDIVVVNAEIERAKQLPEKSADALLNELGYSGGSSQLVQSLFGDQAKHWIKTFTGLFQQAATPKMIADQQHIRGEGQWISFKENVSYPDFLIKNANINGQILLRSEAITFTGSLNNLTHQPKRWDQPATFILQGQSASGATIKTDGSIDLRQQANSTMNLSFVKLPLKQLVLSSRKDMPITLASGQVNGSGTLQINSAGLTVKADNQFSHTVFETLAGTSSTQQLLAEILKSVDHFNLQIQLVGSADNPKLSLKSDLDKALGGAIKQQASAKLNQYKTDLRAELSKTLSPQIDGLNSDADFLTHIKQQLSDKKAQIDQLSKGLL